MNPCKDCGRPTVRKLLLTSYYDHCEKCEFAKALGYPVKVKPVKPTVQSFGGQGTIKVEHVYQSGHVMIGGGGGGGSSGISNEYPKNDPKECDVCSHKLACSCIDLIVARPLGAWKAVVAEGHAYMVNLAQSDRIKFKDSHNDFSAPATGTYHIGNEIGVPVITRIS